MRGCLGQPGDVQFNSPHGRRQGQLQSAGKNRQQTRWKFLPGPQSPAWSHKWGINGAKRGKAMEHSRVGANGTQQRTFNSAGFRCHCLTHLTSMRHVVVLRKCAEGVHRATHFTWRHGYPLLITSVSIGRKGPHLTLPHSILRSAYTLTCSYRQSKLCHIPSLLSYMLFCSTEHLLPLPRFREQAAALEWVDGSSPHGILNRPKLLFHAGHASSRYCCIFYRL